MLVVEASDKEKVSWIVTLITRSKRFSHYLFIEKYSYRIMEFINWAKKFIKIKCTYVHFTFLHLLDYSNPIPIFRGNILCIREMQISSHKRMDNKHSRIKSNPSRHVDFRIFPEWNRSSSTEKFHDGAVALKDFGTWPNSRSLDAIIVWW